MKKGEIVWGYIIGALLALVIVIFMVLLLSGKIGVINQSTTCTAQGGTCIPEKSACDKQSYFPCGKTSDGKKQICCMEDL